MENIEFICPNLFLTTVSFVKKESVCSTLLSSVPAGYFWWQHFSPDAAYVLKTSDFVRLLKAGELMLLQWRIFHLLLGTLHSTAHSGEWCLIMLSSYSFLLGLPLHEGQGKLYISLTYLLSNGVHEHNRCFQNRLEQLVKTLLQSFISLFFFKHLKNLEEE